MSPGLAAVAAVDAPFTAALGHFADAPLDLLQQRALLTRVDRKFLLSVDLLAAILPALATDYRLLRAEGQMAATYRTHYFDAADLRLYDDHRRGRLPRFKVRVRHHIERQLTFLEIKCRRAASGTTKARLPRPFGVDWLDEEACGFIGAHAPIAVGDLRRSMDNTFQRITLLGHNVNERLTIDTDIAISDGGHTRALPGLVILEVKQGRWSNGTPSLRALRSLRVPERAISKYCLAVATLTAARHNTFKPALRAVERYLA